MRDPRAAGAGAKPFVFPCDGQPRRGHRRRPEESAGELRHHRSLHRRADQSQHGHARSSAILPTARRCTWTSNAARSRRASSSSIASSRTPGFAARPRAVSPRCCRSASARSSARRPIIPHGMDRFPELLPQIRDIDHRQLQSAVRRGHRRERLRRDRAHRSRCPPISSPPASRICRIWPSSPCRSSTSTRSTC